MVASRLRSARLIKFHADRLSATVQKMLSQGPVMPSASYYRRQADLLLSFAVTTENPVVSDRCRLLAEEYQSLAAMLGDDQPEVASAVQTVLKRADERGTG
jgi:hypothetical protein